MEQNNCNIGTLFASCSGFTNLYTSFDSLLKVWFDQHRKVKKMSHEMDGKIVLVTGATNGIGKVAALELAKKGAVVTIVGRNAGKTAATAAEISKVSGNPTVEFLLADLSVMAQVRRLAGEFRQNHDRLDVLVNNAGAYFTQRQLSADGYEMTFALNHLSYFLLTDLLLDLLKASASARIVNVSSGAHNLGPLDFNDLMTEDYGMAGFKAYGRSKLANVMFTYELARRLEGSGVTVNALHPGGVNTGFGKNNAGLVQLAMKIFGRFSLTPEQGAQTTIYLASAPEVAGITGKYFDKCKAVPSSEASYDQAAQRKLWEISEKLVAV
jgi:retinol dehydrogenase-12